MQKKITIYGKWILAGEYIVLKNYPALVCPLSSRFIQLKTSNKVLLNKVSSSSLKIKDFDNSQIATKVFEKIFNKALQKISKKWKDLPFYSIQVSSCLPFGSGLGASAVICVLSGKLLEKIGWLKKNDLFVFCHSLEKHLHSQSSGLDIAGVLKQKPLLYQKQSPLSKKLLSQALPLQWKPLIFLSIAKAKKVLPHYKTSNTKTNIQKWKKVYFRSIYLEQMNQAVLLAKKALIEQKLSKNNRLSLLQKSFDLAEECFLKWNLIGREMKQHITDLKQRGALAVKPTGSGGHGYVLSLWKNSPPRSLKKTLIPGF